MLISWEKQLDMIVMGVSGNGLHQPNGIGKNGAYREHPRNAATAHPHTFIQSPNFQKNNGSKKTVHPKFHIPKLFSNGQFRLPNLRLHQRFSVELRGAGEGHSHCLESEKNAAVQLEKF